MEAEKNCHYFVDDISKFILYEYHFILIQISLTFDSKVPNIKMPTLVKIMAWTGDNQGAVSIRKTVLPGMAIPMLKIRRPNGRLIFNMENAIRR